MDKAIIANISQFAYDCTIGCGRDPNETELDEDVIEVLEFFLGHKPGIDEISLFISEWRKNMLMIAFP